MPPTKKTTPSTSRPPATKPKTKPSTPSKKPAVGKPAKKSVAKKPAPPKKRMKKTEEQLMLEALEGETFDTGIFNLVIPDSEDESL